MRCSLSVAVTPVLCTACIFAAHAHAQIQRIGDAVTGISADGTAVSGFGLFNGELQMFRWTTSGGLTPLGPGAAFDISRDGSVLVGSRFNGSVTRAVRWSSSTGIVELGQLPGNNPPGSLFSEAYDVSADGSVIVGISDVNPSPGPPYRGFRWTASTGMVGLGDLPGGAAFSQAFAVSADGQVAVGSSEGSTGTRAVRWLGTNPVPLDMGLPPGRSGFTEAKHVSGDGAVVVGVWGNGVENEAFRWTAAGGYELLGDLPGGLLDSVATATNRDGSVIVGMGNPGAAVPDEPFYWTASLGLRSFRQVLADNGIDFSAWQSFTEVRDLSDDGLIVVGNGILADGTAAGFRIVIPAPASGFSLVLGLAFIARRRRAAQRYTRRRATR